MQYNQNGWDSSAQVTPFPNVTLYYSLWRLLSNMQARLSGQLKHMQSSPCLPVSAVGFVFDLQHPSLLLSLSRQPGALEYWSQH